MIEQLEPWRYIFYFIVIVSIFASLIIYAFFLWGDKKRGTKIEKRGLILFSDDPYEKRVANK